MSWEYINDAVRELLLFYVIWIVEAAVVDCDKLSEWCLGGGGRAAAGIKRAECESDDLRLLWQL